MAGAHFTNNFGTQDLNLVTRRFALTLKVIIIRSGLNFSHAANFGPDWINRIKIRKKYFLQDFSYELICALCSVPQFMIGQHRAYWMVCRQFALLDQWCNNVWCEIASAEHFLHCSDIIMSAMASPISGVSVVYSTVCSGADQMKYQYFASLAFVRVIHKSPVNSPHQGPISRKMFPFDDVIMWFLDSGISY